MAPVGGRRSRRSTVVRVLVVIGGLAVLFGLLAGHLNRELFHGSTFAGNVDEIRRDSAVAAGLGNRLSAEIIAANPDLVAIRPLVEDVSTRVAGGDLLTGPTRLAAQAAHSALVDGGTNSIVLRIADAGAVISGVLAAAVPDRAPLTTDASVTLASVGERGFAPAIVTTARSIGTLAWLLPAIALTSFGAAIGLSRSRWRTGASVGQALLWAAAAAGGILVLGGFLVRQLDPNMLGGAVARAAWNVVLRPLWWNVAVLAVVAISVVLVCGSSVPTAIAGHAARVRAALLRRPEGALGIAGRGLVAAALGVAAIIDPLGLIELLVVLAGVGLVLFAISEFARLAAAARAASTIEVAPDGPERGGRGTPRTAALAVLAAAGLVVVAGVAATARPGDEVPVAEADTVSACNGHVELCDRPFDEVAYVASHNAMSVASEPGWFLAEQFDPIPDQLDQGVRALLIDVWSGRSAGTVVRTAESSYEEALAVAESELGPEVVAAARRVADSVAGEAVGPEARYLCHGLCETGSTPLLQTLGRLRGWMAANPHEVVTLFIEDHVDAGLIAADVEAAGLLPIVYEPVASEPWPTLGEMIQSGRRLVVMLEAGQGGPDSPWLVNGFEFVQETPFAFPTVDSFSCEPNRGPADASLFLLNHWLLGFNSLVTDAQHVNQRDVLLQRAEQCRTERDQIPNFVAVNFVTLGDVAEVVDILNSVD